MKGAIINQHANLKRIFDNYDPYGEASVTENTNTNLEASLASDVD